MTTGSLRARHLRRAALRALIVASSGVACLSPSDAAFGATFTFTSDFADMRDPNAWTPTGIPGTTDLAFFQRRGPGDNTNVDLTLTSEVMDVGGMEYDTSRIRNIYNSDPINGSTLTLSGLPNHPLIQMNLGDSNTLLGIRGAGSFTSGDGASIVNAGSLNVILASSGEFRTTSGAQLFIGADISEVGGVQSIIKGGQGSLVLAGNNTFSGDFTVNTGSALLSGTNTIRNLISASTTASVSCNITGGLSVLQSAEAHRGTLSFDASSNVSPKILSSASLIFSGGNVVQNGNATQSFSQTVNGAYIKSGQSVLRIDTNTAGAMSSTMNVGEFHRTLGGYLNINYATNGSSIPAVTTTTQNDPTYGIIGAWLNVGNNDWAANDGSGNVIPFNGYQTEDNESNWQPNRNVSSSTGSAFTGTPTAGLTIASLRFNSSATNDTVNVGSGQTLTLGTGGILVASNAGASSSFIGGNITSGSGEILINTNGSKTLTVSSVIANNGGSALTLTKVGSGTLVLNGANSFTGGAFLNTGTVVVNSFAAKTSPSSLGADGTIHLGGPNNTRLIYGGASASTNRDFFLGEGTQVFQFTTNGGTLTLSGNIDGPGGLIKMGGNTSGTNFSTLDIDGAKNFGGPVQVYAGMISVDTLALTGQPSGIGTGNIDPTITLGALLNTGSSGTLEYRGTIDATCNRPLELGPNQNSNGGSINLVTTQPDVTLAWTGDYSCNGGAATSVSFNGASIALIGTNINNLRPFRLSAAASGTIIFSGNIGTGSDPDSPVYGRLVKDGDGTVILGGQNQYQLGTTVTKGTLVTLSNFSNGTVTTVGTISSSATNDITALNISANATAIVAQKPANNDPSGTTALPWNSGVAIGDTGLVIAAGGKLDLNNNAMMIYGAITPGDVSSDLRTYLKAGHDTGWAGAAGTPAIVSTSAKNSPPAHPAALGYARASDLGLAVGSDFHGVAVVNPTDTLIAYTLEGDANLDGVVNALDFNALASNFGQNNGAQTWVNGDFDYNNSVNTADFTAMSRNFGLTTPSPAPALGTLVPEPAEMSLLALMLGFTQARRRRR